MIGHYELFTSKTIHLLGVTFQYDQLKLMTVYRKGFGKVYAKRTSLIIEWTSKMIPSKYIQAKD